MNSEKCFMKKEIECFVQNLVTFATTSHLKLGSEAFKVESAIGDFEIWAFRILLSVSFILVFSEEGYNFIIYTYE